PPCDVTGIVAQMTLCWASPSMRLARPQVVPDCNCFRVARDPTRTRDAATLFLQVVRLEFSNSVYLYDDSAFLRCDKMRDAGRNDDETTGQVEDSAAEPPSELLVENPYGRDYYGRPVWRRSTTSNPAGT